jgi:predicted nucleotidyltransferase
MAPVSPNGRVAGLFVFLPLLRQDHVHRGFGGHMLRAPVDRQKHTFHSLYNEIFTMSAELPVAIPQQAIAAFCERNHMRRLSLFGSILTARFSDKSDIDVLVEFDPGHVPGLFDLSGMELELSKYWGAKSICGRRASSAATFGKTS